MVTSDPHGRGSLKGFEAYADKAIPDQLAAPEAAKLGALCNKVFE